MDETRIVEAPTAREEPQLGRLFSNTFLKWSAVVLSLGAIGLHFLGTVSHEAYLTTWGIDDGLFSKPIDWLLIRGYTVVFYCVAQLWIWIEQSILWVAVWIVVASILAYLFVHLSERPIKNSIGRWLRCLPKKIAHVVTIAIVALFMFLVALIAPAIAAVLIYTPIELGERHGAAIAKEELAAFTQGCSQRKKKARCVELKRVGQPTVTGFVLDSSESHVAIYVVSSHTVQVLKRDSFDAMEGRAASLDGDEARSK